MSIENTMVVSYLFLRRAVGILGLAFPPALVFGGMVLYGLEVQSSLSAYYHTDMRDVFVGALCAISMFLLSYKGYVTHDNIVATCASVCALGIAFFPTFPESPPWKGWVHVLSAVGFFIALSWMSIYLFTKTKDPRTRTRRKKWRNVIYWICGITMLACLVLVMIIELSPDLKAKLQKSYPILWLEWIAISAFGISWLTKGEWILWDSEAEQRLAVSTKEV